MVFNLFVDSIETVVEKLSKYFNVNKNDIKYALRYGCSAQSFVEELKLNFCLFDSSNVNIVGRHVTTACDEDLVYFYKKGLLNLSQTLQETTPLQHFLSSIKSKLMLITIGFIICIKRFLLQEIRICSINVLCEDTPYAVGLLDVKHFKNCQFLKKNCID